MNTYSSNYNQPTPQPPKKKHRIRNAFLAIVGGFVLLIVIIVSATAGSSHTPTPTPSATGAPPAAAALKATPKPTKLPGIGTSVRDGKFQFTVSSVSRIKSDGLGDTAQGEYTVINVSVTNIGTESQMFDDSNQYVYDSSGRKFDASSEADIDLNDDTNNVFLEDINPGNTVSGRIAFDMPTGDSAARMELHDSIFSGGITVALR